MKPGGLTLRQLALRAAFLACACILGLSAEAPGQNLRPRIFNLTERLLAGAPNILGPTSMVLDTRRGLVYVSARGYNPIAAFEIYGGRRRFLTLAAPDSLRGTLRLLHVNSRSGALLAVAQPTADRPECLYVTNPQDPQARFLARFDAGAGAFVSVETDPDVDRLFVSMGRRHILILDGSSLLPVDSIDAGFETAGIAVDSVHQRLYIAQRAPVDRVTRMLVVSTVTLERVRDTEYETEDVFDRVVVDPGTQRSALHGGGRMRFMDAFGRPAGEVRISGDIGDAVAVPQFNSFWFFRSAAVDEQGLHGRFGKVYRWNFVLNSLDSAVLGLDAQRLVYYPATREVAVLNQGSSAIDVLNAGDLSLRRTLSMGHSLEDVLLSADGYTLYVTNALGSGYTVTLFETRSSAANVMRAGPWPVRLIRDPATHEVILLNHFQNTLRFVDSTLFIAADTLLLSNVFENRTNALPSLAINPNGIALLTLPEQASMVLVQTAARRVLRTERISGYRFTGEDGAGALQAAFTSDGLRFGVLALRSRTLGMYRTDRSGVQRSMDLSGFDWSRMAPFAHECLRTGRNANELVVGPYVINIDSGIIDSLRVNGPVLQLGSDEFRWAIQYGEQSMELLRSDTQNGDPLFRDAIRFHLDDAAPHPDVVRLDVSRRVLILGYQRDARVLIYDLPRTTRVTAPPREDVMTVELYPNPVRRSDAVVLHLNLQGVPNVNDARVSIHDILGRCVTTGTLHGTDVEMDLRSVKPGVYTMVIHTDLVQFSHRLVVSP